MKPVKQFTRKQWEGMPTVTEPDALHGRIKSDDDGNLWEWVRSGLRVDVKPVTHYPFRNDLHRLMSPACKSWFK